MILKESDSLGDDIDRLEALLRDPRADGRARREIEDTIRKLRAGERGEKGAAYHIKSFYGASRNWVIIHDLRIEHKGLVAQIDHLLIGRLLDFWVLESKHVSGGVKINQHREFTTFHDGKPRGMASPIEQNERHVRLLQAVFDAGAIRMPKRLGITLRPRFRPLVLISNGAISRPKQPFPGLETVIKSENLQSHILEQGDRGNALDLAKLVSQATLEDIGRQLLALHRPIVFDWERRLGIAPDPERFLVPVATPSMPEAAVPQPISPAPAPRPARPPAAPSPPPAVSAAPPTPAAPRPRGTCAGCGQGVTSGVKAYCRKYPERFGGQILCMTCQAIAATPT